MERSTVLLNFVFKLNFLLVKRAILRVVIFIFFVGEDLLERVSEYFCLSDGVINLFHNEVDGKERPVFVQAQAVLQLLGVVVPTLLCDFRTLAQVPHHP